MFEGFERHDIDTEDARIASFIGGSGPPLLLLHGYPQTHVAWHRLAPVLSQHYTVVATDLRGYGDSRGPQLLRGLRKPGHADERVTLASELSTLAGAPTLFVRDDFGSTTSGANSHQLRNRLRQPDTPALRHRRFDLSN